MSEQKRPIAGAAAGRAPSNTFVYVAAAFAALGGLLFGYDTGVISGALTFIQKSFALSTIHQELVVAVVLIGACVGALSGGRFADRFGRRKMLIFTAIIFVAGALICAAAADMTMLIVGRAIVGLGIGFASSTVPLYISEVSPAGARGWQVSLFQFAITVGILVAYLVDYGFTRSGGWRWMLGLAVVPGAALGLGMLVLPESPRWHAQHGNVQKARSVLVKVRGTEDVDAEMREIEATLTQAHEHGRISDLWLPEVRVAMVVGIGLAILQQVTGINTVIYYAPKIIQSAGISSASGAILATAGIGLVNVVMTIVAMWLIDRVGRRPLLLVGIAGMTVSLGVLGYVFYLPTHGHSLATIAVVTMMCYVAMFAISLGPIFWLLIAEIYPLKIRGAAEGVAAGANWAANFAITFTFLTLLDKIGAAWTFWLFALLAVAAWIFSFVLVPETKGRTLEDIEAGWRAKKHAV
jgi:MFS transporter, SP family, galactose:H+ symporter